MLAAGQILVRLKSKGGLPVIRSLPRQHVVPYFSPDEKVEYKDPTTGRVSIAEVHQANGEQWPPYYAIRIIEPDPSIRKAHTGHGLPRGA